MRGIASMMQHDPRRTTARAKVRTLMRAIDTTVVGQRASELCDSHVPIFSFSLHLTLPFMLSNNLST